MIMTPPASNAAAWELAGVGAITTSPVGRIVWQNAVGGELLDRADGVISRSGLISSTDRTSATMLADRIRQAAQPQNRCKSAAEQALRIPRTVGSPLLVLVAPLPASDAVASDAAVILLITDPDRRLTILGRHLVEWFGLTPAEADLAVQLANGARLEDLTARKGVRISTLRSQLRAVLGKTGADRQADLVGLLHRLPTISSRRLAQRSADQRLNADDRRDASQGFDLGE